MERFIANAKQQETLEEKLAKIVSKEPSKFWTESDERARIREEKKQHLIDMMRNDEELGLYDEPKQETLEEAAEKYNSQFIGQNEFAIEDFKNGAKWQQEQNNTSKVRRVEVIQHSPPYNGRAYTNYAAKDVEIEFQDDGKTLKIFLK
jgi:hypothetical protein